MFQGYRNDLSIFRYIDPSLVLTDSTDESTFYLCYGIQRQQKQQNGRGRVFRNVGIRLIKRCHVSDGKMLCRGK